MFIREKKTKTTTVLQLIESRWCGNWKAKQEIIVSLGSAPIPDQCRREIAEKAKTRPPHSFWFESIVGRDVID